MSKKHKHTNDQTRIPVRGIYSKEYNLTTRDTEGKINAVWELADLENYHKLPYQIPQSIPNQQLARSLKKQYLRANPTEADIRAYDSKIHDLKIRLEQQFGDMLSHCKDISPVLNIWSSDAKTAVIDTIDFREYFRTEDITDNAFNALQENPDVSMCWLPSEYADIILSDAVFYRVHRTAYDERTNGVRYNMCEYHRIAMSDNEIITAPIYMCSMEYIPSKIEDIRRNVDAKCATMSNSESADMKKEFNRLCHDIPDCKLIEILNMGQIHIGSLSIYMSNNHDNLPKPTYRLFKEMMAMIAHDVYANIELSATAFSSELKNHLCTTTDLLIAAILVTNSFLKQNKLSKPVLRSIDHEIEVILQNRPERKTRVLGSNITITSETRPKTPDKDRIIRYHVPEWQRKAHLRHLKNGKVIEIPAGQCQRRCVDMSNVKNKLPTQGTDYIIRPNHDVNNTKKGT